MAIWMTWGQIKRRLESGQLGDLRFSDNEKIFFGDDDDAALYFDGTYWRVDGAASELLVKLSTAGEVALHGGADATDDLILMANAAVTYPRIRLVTGTNMFLEAESGRAIQTRSEGTNVLNVGPTSMTYSPSGATGTKATWNYAALTTGTAFHIQCNALTEGVGLQVSVDSDILTTGKLYQGLSGSDTNTEVYSVNGAGSVQCHKADGSSRYVREFHLPAANASAGGSGATATVKSAVFGWLLDATNEFIYFGTDVHSDWDTTTDLTIEVTGYIDNAETADDTINMTLVCDYYGEHDDLDSVKTQTLTQDHDIVNDNGANVVHTLTFTFDHDLGGNVLEVADRLAIRINMDALGGGS